MQPKKKRKTKPKARPKPAPKRRPRKRPSVTLIDACLAQKHFRSIGKPGDTPVWFLQRMTGASLSECCDVMETARRADLIISEPRLSPRGFAAVESIALTRAQERRLGLHKKPPADA